MPDRHLSPTFIILICFFLFSCSPKSSSTETPFRHDTTLKIINANNEEIVFDVEFAITDYQKERGLMYRYKMEPNQAMFFIFERQEIRSFWMKNTYISLDMVFIDENFQIVDIYENAFPLSEESILSKVPAKYVLEIRGGLSKSLGIEIGNKVEVSLP